MKTQVVHFVESLVPKKAVLYYRTVKKQYLFNKKQKEYAKKITDLKKDDRPIHVIFLAIAESVWKYDSLYWLMEKDPMYDPMVLICPQVNKGEEYMMRQLTETYIAYEKKGYKVINSYNKDTKSFIDLDNLKPDILMYTNPYKGLIMDKYYLDNVRNVLTCYISYYYPKGIEGYHKLLETFESALWKNFVVSEVDKSRIRFKANVVVSGYPMYEAFAKEPKKGKDWKIKDTAHKRIIWAPYHMLEVNAMGVQVSTFLLYAEFMLEMAEKYKDKVQFVFKPHPLLRPALEKLSEWGKEKTNRYYELWQNGYNTAYTNGEYVDLFNTSDAIIHDCGSFTIEYLYVNKPAMYLESQYPANVESVGKEAHACYKIGRNEEDIEKFINNIINGEEDFLKKNRLDFYKKHLLPPNGCSAAENILNEIKKEIGR